MGAVSVVERIGSQFAAGLTPERLEELLERYPESYEAEIFDYPLRLAFYLAQREAGVEHVWAAMTAVQRAPGGDTDREFLFGHTHGRQFDNMPEFQRTYILESARKAGISIQGKVFKAGLGKPSDPLAWVDGKDDVRKACAAKGMSCEGAVKFDFPTPAPKKVPLAEGIIKRRVNEILNDPREKEKLKKKPSYMRTLRERVVAKHGSKRK